MNPRPSSNEKFLNLLNCVSFIIVYGTVLGDIYHSQLDLCFRKGFSISEGKVKHLAFYNAWNQK